MASGTGGRKKVVEDKTRGAYEEHVVKIKRCAAVVKGGRRFSFAAMVVVGDREGRVGWGYGKANEVPPSVEKAVKQATRNMNKVPLIEGTIQVERILLVKPKILLEVLPDGRRNWSFAEGAAENGTQASGASGSSGASDLDIRFDD